MNADLTPAVVAASGGSALITIIMAREHRLDAAMRRDRVQLGARFPLALSPASARAALAGLSGLPEQVELVASTVASSEGIRHHFLVPGSTSVLTSLVAAIPGLRLVETPAPTGTATLAMRLFVPTPTLLRSDEIEMSSRALLSGLATLRGNEEVVVSWALRPTTPRRAFHHEPEDRETKELARLWRAKIAEPGFAVSGLVLVRAERIARARELLAHVADCVRSRRSRTAGIRTTVGRGNRSLATVARTTRQAAGSASMNCCHCLAFRLVMTWCLAWRWVPPANCLSRTVLLVRGGGCFSGATPSAIVQWRSPPRPRFIISP